MWILCLAEDSLETSSLIFSEKQWKNISDCRLLQLWLAPRGLTCMNSYLVLWMRSVLSHILRRLSGHHRWLRNNPFPSCPIFSCPSWADHVHFRPLFGIVFNCLPLLLPFNVPCWIISKQEDLETWPNHLSFPFLTKVRSSSYSSMAA